uniref:Transmembrane protein putative n=1 Tax=Albugo laibachii Nc14 TaxID=890382 RepID=F0WFM3_9STRA|nr:transmembrane protein putative [Albugo laibachii Nc14]CCA23282.1 transmembrane protein putative [Albugo laibachii Nc14]|eukprot:CCA23282.1 transmembrane protein putative [Albugo laibachii Nc14]
MITIQLTFLHNIEAPVVQQSTHQDENPPEWNEQTHVSTNRWPPVNAFYRMCEQRAVWQLVTFLMIAMAASRYNFERGVDVLKQLSHLRPSSELFGNAFRMLVNLATMFAWESWWINASWRCTVLMTILVCSVLEIIRFMAILYVDSARNEYFYYTIYSFFGIGDAILIIFTFIPVTEIAEFGLEGATSGLFASFRSIMGTSVRTICKKISHLEYFATISKKSISHICLLFWFVTIIQSGVCFAIPLLPRQKLDAQQLRAYGGYSHKAFIFLCISFVSTFVIATYLNIHSIYGILHNWY